MRKPLLMAIAIAAVIVALPVAAQAAILTGFAINLNVVTAENMAGAGYLYTTPFNPPDTEQLVYSGLAHQHLTNGVFQIDGLLGVDAVRDGGQVTQTDQGWTLNGIAGNRFEITMDYSLEALATSATSFVHLPASGVGAYDGLLNIYVQNLALAGAVRHNPNILPGGGTGGAGFTDGTLVATLSVLGGGGGSFNISTLDGSDDATFQFVSAVRGLLVQPGVDGVFGTADDFDWVNGYYAGPDAIWGTADDVFKPGWDPSKVTALIDSNVDFDRDNNGLVDSGPPSNWPFANKGVNFPSDAFVTEDGSANFAFVPEPASMAAWGLLLGLMVSVGVFRRARA